MLIGMGSNCTMGVIGMLREMNIQIAIFANMEEYTYIAYKPTEKGQQPMGWLNTEPDSRLNPEPIYSVKVPVDRELAEHTQAYVQEVTGNSSSPPLMVGADAKSLDIPVQEVIDSKLTLTHIVSVRSNTLYWANKKDAMQYPMNDARARAMFIRNSHWFMFENQQWEFMSERQVRFSLVAGQTAMEIAFALQDDDNVFSAAHLQFRHDGKQYLVKGEWFNTIDACVQKVREALAEGRKVFLHDVQQYDGRIYVKMAISNKPQE